MPQIQIFACPSCGASTSIEEGDVQIKCPFCGNTIIVPEELRIKRSTPAYTSPPPSANVSQSPVSPAYPPVYQPPTRSKAAGPLIGIAFLTGCIVVFIALGAAFALFSLESPPAEIATRVSDIELPTLESPTLESPSPADILEPIAPPAFAEVVLSFGGEGTGTGRFQDARSIAVDGEGNIYVAEYQSGRVQKFDAQGEFLDSWIAEGDTPLRGLATDREGSVYVVRGGVILKYEGATGELLQKIKGEGYFDDVAVLPDGGLLACACLGADDLVYLDSDGETVSRVREAITRQTDTVTSIVRLAVDGLGNVFLLSAFDSAIFKFTPEGEFVDKFSGEGDEPGQLRAPYAIAVDGQGRIYVSDFKGIQVFDSDGRYLDLIKPPDFAFAYGLTFNDEGELFAVGNEHVYKFALNEE